MSVSLLEEGNFMQQPDGKQAYIFTPVYNRPPGSSGSHSGNIILYIGMTELIPINYECEFAGNIYQMRKENPAHPNFYLLIQRSEKTLPTTGNPQPSSQPENYLTTSYTILKLNNPNESINYGDFEIPLYPAPVLNPPTANPLIGTISFTVSDLKGLPYADSHPKDIKPDPNPMDPIEEKKNDSVIDLVIENCQPMKGTPIDEKDSIVFYIDSMRFIPNICGAIKVNLKGFNCNLICNINETNMIPNDSIIFPIVESTVGMPYYNQKRIFKSNKLDPTTILVGNLEIFDTFTGKDFILGYFLINLFVEKYTGNPISNPKIEGDLNEGEFQLPIFCENPLPKPFVMTKL